MGDRMDDRETCDYMRIAFYTLADIVQEQEKAIERYKGKEFLIDYFNEDNDLFCQFLGFSRVEAETTPIPYPLLVNMLLEVAAAGVYIGWKDCFKDTMLSRPVRNTVASANNNG